MIVKFMIFFGNTPAKYGFYYRKFDCYDLLMNKIQDKHDYILKQNIESMLNSKDDKILKQSLYFED